MSKQDKQSFFISIVFFGSFQMLSLLSRNQWKLICNAYSLLICHHRKYLPLKLISHNYSCKCVKNDEKTLHTNFAHTLACSVIIFVYCSQLLCWSISRTFTRKENECTPNTERICVSIFFLLFSKLFLISSELEKKRLRKIADKRGKLHREKRPHAQNRKQKTITAWHYFSIRSLMIFVCD